MSPRGDGSVYPITLPSGAKRFKASLVIDGKRVEKTGKTRTEANGLLKALRIARDKGLRDVGRPQTFQKWLHYWLDEIAPGRCGEDTLARYRGVITNWIVPAIGEIRLPSLTPEHVRKVHRAMFDAGLSGSSVYQAHAVMRRSLKVAMAEGKVERNVAQLVDGPSVQRDEVTPLTRQEARRILRLVEQEDGGVRWTLALALGLRQGEVLGLTREMLDLDNRRLTVRDQLKRHKPRHGCAPAAGPDGRWECGYKQPSRCSQRIGNAGLYLKDPKSRKSRRTVALPVQLAAALRRHLADQSAARLALGSRWKGWERDGQPVELVFCRPNGRPLDARVDHDDWKELLDRAGVPEVRLHDARHTAASILLEMGEDVKVVSEMLGHATTYFTQATYQHVVPELMTGAADSMSAALWGPDEEPAPRSPRRRRRAAR